MHSESHVLMVIVSYNFGSVLNDEARRLTVVWLEAGVCELADITCISELLIFRDRVYLWNLLWDVLMAHHTTDPKCVQAQVEELLVIYHAHWPLPAVKKKKIQSAVQPLCSASFDYVV